MSDENRGAVTPSLTPEEREQLRGLRLLPGCNDCYRSRTRGAVNLECDGCLAIVVAAVRSASPPTPELSVEEENNLIADALRAANPQETVTRRYAAIPAPTGDDATALEAGQMTLTDVTDVTGRKWKVGDDGGIWCATGEMDWFRVIAPIRVPALRLLLALPPLRRAPPSEIERIARVTMHAVDLRRNLDDLDWDATIARVVASLTPEQPKEKAPQ